MSGRSTSLRLQPSETAVLHAASRLYAAYITAGRVEVGQEAAYIKRSIEEAHYRAKLTDQLVIFDDEMG
ncbi:MAG: hypothetical protein VXW65_07710 [Pseudomonadota bacterium]|nr:hypothetical protein [Pseudomonadota bacterium]